MNAEIASISNSVQRNCHIADARVARDYTMCIYLLKMREYFRWEKGYDYDDQMPKEDIGEWLRDREAMWEQLEVEEFTTIPIGGQQWDPFATEDINRLLRPQGLVYSGGLGGGARPHFFLAELMGYEQRCGFDIYISDKEIARDLAAYPAMTLGKSIFVRRESVRRMVWEKMEEWRWHPRDNAMGRAMDAYRAAKNMSAAFEELSDDVMELAVLHEMGEAMVGEQLGETWDALLLATPRSKAELMLRAVRDHLADSLCALPALLQQGPHGLLHYYFATLGGMRKELAPGLRRAYDRWIEEGDMQPLQQVVGQSTTHWLQVAESACRLYQQQPEALDVKALAQSIEQQRL